MPKALLATIADKNYKNQAKQFFSGAYFNAGWDGDCMILTSDIGGEDASWFEERGIIVNKKPLLFNKKIGGMSPILCHKFYLFSEEFKKWETIIYIDCDTIIMAPLNGLKNIQKFSAVKDAFSFAENISHSMRKYNKLPNELISINPRKKFFNAGFFVFNTRLINNGEIKKYLISLAEKYDRFSRFGEQLIFNIAFPNWKALCPLYNFYINFYVSQNKGAINMKMKNIRPYFLHFTGPFKPWNRQNIFFSEWFENLRRAKKINFRIKPQAGKTAMPGKIYCFYVSARIILFLLNKNINNKIGRVGIYIKIKNPYLYHLLKKIISIHR